MYPNIHCIQMK